MVPMLSRFSSAIARPLDLILHIGPGVRAFPADYAPLHPAQLVLVDANPATSSRLQTAFERSDFPTFVFEKLLLPESGSAALFQFNLPAVNGIRPAGALPTLYPNLRLLEELPLEGEAFSSFLATLPLENEGPCLLVMDVPGQELALLESLPHGLLARFEWILIRGCASEWQERSNILRATTDFLDRRYYESVATDFESDPAWPLQLLRLNRTYAELRCELDSRVRQVEAQTTELEQQALQIAALELELSRLVAAASGFADTRAAFEAELDSRAMRIESQVLELEGHAGRIAHLEHELSGHVAAASVFADTRAALETELNTRAMRIESQGLELEGHAGRIAHLEHELSGHVAAASVFADTRAALEAELDTRAMRIESQALELEEHARRIAQLEHELSGHVAAASGFSDTRANLEAELETRARLLIEKATEIYEQSRRLAQFESQLAQLQSQSDSLLTELHSTRELVASHSQDLATTVEQLAHAHAQVRSLETSKTDLESELSSQKTLVQALTKGRAQQDQFVADLAAERDALQASIKGAQLRIAECDAQLAAKNACTSLLDAEFQKIEGQMEMLKSLVFPDHGR